MLATADELISHSGKRHDLLVLEQVCGSEHVVPIWDIPHIDLFEVHNWASVETLARRYVPDLLRMRTHAHKIRIKQANPSYS